METPKSTPKKILWAVDPFSGNRTVQRATLQAIKTLTKSQNTEIFPVYVLTAGFFEPLMPLLLGSKRNIQVSGQSEIERISAGLKLKGMQPLKIIVEPSFSKRKGCQTLVDHARKIKADLIALGTHSKTGPQRWVMGSFAETLALLCDLPFLVVNPSWKRAKTFDRILFPTDFSPESHAAFKRVMELAHQLDAKIILYHQFRADLTPGLIYVLESYTAYEPNYDKDLARSRAEIEKWLQEAREEGLQVEGILDSKATGSAAQSILKQARKGVALIAMGARSGPISASLLGSTTRDIMRRSPYPVWIIHPKVPVVSITQADVEADLYRKEAYS